MIYKDFRSIVVNMIKPKVLASYVLMEYVVADDNLGVKVSSLSIKDVIFKFAFTRHEDLIKNLKKDDLEMIKGCLELLDSLNLRYSNDKGSKGSLSKVSHEQVSDVESKLNLTDKCVKIKQQINLEANFESESKCLFSGKILSPINIEPDAPNFPVNKSEDDSSFNLIKSTRSECTVNYVGAGATRTESDVTSSRVLKTNTYQHSLALQKRESINSNFEEFEGQNKSIANPSFVTWGRDSIPKKLAFHVSLTLKASAERPSYAPKASFTGNRAVSLDYSEPQARTAYSHKSKFNFSTDETAPNLSRLTRPSNFPSIINPRIASLTKLISSQQLSSESDSKVAELTPDKPNNTV